MATAEQLALLRSMVDGDFERHEELSHAMRASGDLEEYGAVLAAATYIAVRMQVPERYSADDVILLVANARALIDQSGDAVDPRAAELVVRSALGERGLVTSLPDAAVVQGQLAVCSYLAAERKLGDSDVFMGEVQKLLDEWASDEDS
jgi:hypothetical protein